MAFVPRTFEEIRDDMIAYVRMQTDLTDFEVGSVIRTLIEAAALEDDEQYFQMVQLLDAFRLSSSAGQDLDDRVAEFGIVRLQPEASTGEVSIQDDNLVTSLSRFNVVAGATSIFVESSSAFPTSGFPHNVRIGEGTIGEEDNQITANNTTTGELTLSAPTGNDHSASDRVSIVTGVDRTLSTGIRVQVPSTGTALAIVYNTVEAGVLLAGNFESSPLRIRAEVPGTNGNVGAGKIVEFAGAPPFDGAGVTNKKNTAGGRELETDPELRDRARAAIQALPRGTVLALSQAVLGVEDAVTGQRVTTANILESFVTNEVIVFVDDGTGFSPDRVDLARTTVRAPGSAPAALSIPITAHAAFPDEGFVLVSPASSDIEILEYSAVIRSATPSLTLVGTATNAHVTLDELFLVDLITASAESGSNFFTLSNYPVIRGSYRIWAAPGLVGGGNGPPVLQVEGVDYTLNRGTGQFEFFGAGVTMGTKIVANYSYYTALIADVQKVIDGDPADTVNFPGIRAAGVRVVVEVPIIRRITIRLSITAEPGIQEIDLVPTVKEAVEAYINSLGIGADVVRSEIVSRVMSVAGVFDVIVILPTSNLIILENELPRPVDTNGNSLVTVN